MQALILFCVIGLSLGQEEVVNANGGVRRLRLRRPRPVPAISDPDGIAEGRPIPLRRIPQGKTSSSQNSQISIETQFPRLDSSQIMNGQ